MTRSAFWPTCRATALYPSIHIVHIGQGLVCRLPSIRWYTTSDRPGAVNSSLSRTLRTGVSPASRSSGPSRNT